jgi:hypothetical protein
MDMRISTLIIIIFICQNLFCQKSFWSTLSIVNVTKSYNSDFGYEVSKTKVSPLVKSFESKEVILEGFIIPLSGKLAQSHFMLSKFSEKMCFFCGKAGPESVAQVFLANNKKQAYTDSIIKVKGTLRINENDPSELLYTLDNAIIISE